MMLFLVLVIPILLLIFIVLLHYYQMHLSRNARLVTKVPGPKPFPIIGNSMEFGNTTVDILKNLDRLWREHGTLYRFWVGPYLFIFISEAKYAEPFLNSYTNISKNVNYKFLHAWLGTGLLTSKGSKWKHHRKIITPTFHFKILEEFMDVFNTNGNILIQKLRKEAGGEEFDIYNYITLCALDIICESAMGVQMNIQYNTDSDYVTALQQLADIIMKRSVNPIIFPDVLFNMSQLGKKQKVCLEILHDTTKRVIAGRKKELFGSGNGNTNQVENENEFGQKKRLAFLDLLLQYNKQGGNLTDEEIREEVDTFMFEGHDTTASGLSFCLWLLAKNPEYQNKVYEEQYGIFGGTDRDITVKDLQEMKYLECVLKESMRIYPSVPFFVRELDEDVELDGNLFVKGTNVVISPFFMNRNPEYFPEPEKFDPDRFSAEQSHGRNPYAYVPFSAGPRNCIGQKFAMLEMKSTLSKILRNFKLTPGSREMILSAELVLKSSGGVYVKLENRKTYEI